jgi:hypothetical protein
MHRRFGNKLFLPFFKVRCRLKKRACDTGVFAGELLLSGNAIPLCSPGEFRIPISSRSNSRGERFRGTAGGNSRRTLKALVFRMLAAAAALIAATVTVRAASPLELWPSKTKPAGGDALKQQLATLDASAAALPAQLRPAIEFQKVFLQIISGADASAWRGELEKFASASGSDATTGALRELARVWLARAEMQQIDAILRKYYQEKVAFPDSLDAVKENIPAELRHDPWDKPWVYKLRAPRGMAKLASQRYTLAPGQHPELKPLKQSTGERNPPPRAWKITPRDVAGTRALEFRSASGSSAMIQPGGKVEDCTLVFVGPNWALMAGLDQLFAVTF